MALPRQRSRALDDAITQANKDILIAAFKRARRIIEARPDTHPPTGQPDPSGERFRAWLISAATDPERGLKAMESLRAILAEGMPDE